jgi:nicotinamidase-related amidase
MTPLEHLRFAMADTEAYYKKQGIFQGKFGFGTSPALVVIDMAYGWTDPAYAGGSARLDPAIAAIQQLLPAARTRGIPVIYTTSPHWMPMPKKSAADYSPNFRKWDDRACAIDERVKPQDGEYVIYKEYASAFAGTALAGHLMASRVDTLLITDAKTYHLKPVIIREAVQDRSEIAHEWTLFDIQARFADVVNLDEALRYLRG